ncbi:MAG: nitrate/nitrite transporter [Candidatus Brocadiales bacterium]
MAKTTKKRTTKHTSGSGAQTTIPAEPPGNPTVLYLATISFFFCFAIWALYAPFGPYFMKWYGLSAGQVLILVAIPALLGSVIRIPMGILADKYGGRIVFTVLLFFCILPLVGAIFVNSYVMFLICGLFFGVSGTSFIIGITHVSNWYPQTKQGTALGIYGVGNVGTILATIFVPILINNFFGDPAVGPPRIALGSMPGWHLIFGIYAIPALAMGIIYWIMTSEPPRRHKAKTFGEIFSVYKSSGLTWIFSYLYWMTFGGFVCFSLFSPTYFYDRWDVDRYTASLVYTTIFVLITALIRSFGGWLSDRINPRQILIVTYGVSLGALVAMTAEISFPVQVGCLYLLGFCCGIGNACVFKLIPSYFTAVGAVGGLAGAMGGVGGFCMPIVMGMIKNATGSYKYGFGIWVAICLGTLIVVLMPKLFHKQRV